MAFLSGQRLDQLLSGRDNNLNLIRIIAASAVLVSHAYPITLGPGVAEPLMSLTGNTLGHFAVAVFFCISGLLISRSFDRKNSYEQFIAARVLRLFPALLVALFFTVLFGAFFTRLPIGDYLRSVETLTYVPRNLSLAFLQFPLPGVFEVNPYGPAINGSLWTLFYEVLCYCVVLGIGALGLLRQPRLYAVLICFLAIAYYLNLDFVPKGAIEYRAHQMFDLAFPFGLGSAFYVWRERIIVTLPVAMFLWCCVVPFVGTEHFYAAMTIPLCYTTIWVAYIPKGFLLKYNILGDFSYGTYIYAFPVQQAAVYLSPGQSPLENMAYSMPVTLLLSVLSWYIIEKKALGGVAAFSAMISSTKRGISGSSS